MNPSGSIADILQMNSLDLRPRSVFSQRWRGSPSQSGHSSTNGKNPTHDNLDIGHVHSPQTA